VSEMSIATESRSDRFALGALVAGVAALVIFIIAPFTSDALWPIGLAVAVVGAVLGWLALRRTTRGERARTMAITGLAASGIVIVWFLVYLIVSAFD
jgi:ABC-type tungstate transport system substrate-binding protein